MEKTEKRWLESPRQSQAQKLGNALVKLLNDPPLPQTFLVELLAEAQLVYRGLADYTSLGEFRAALKAKKLPAGLLESYERLNEKLATFIHAPHIDWHEFYEGNRVSWTLANQEFPTAHLGKQIGWVLQLFAQGSILRVRRCEECTKWYFAHISNQKFCSDSCRGKNFSQSESAKEHRRKYMRDYYKIQRSKNVK